MFPCLDVLDLPKMHTIFGESKAPHLEAVSHYQRFEVTYDSFFFFPFASFVVDGCLLEFQFQCNCLYLVPFDFYLFGGLFLVSWLLVHFLVINVPLNNCC